MKEPVTPKTIIVRQLRQLWLRSRERGEALRLAKYNCAICGKHKSVKKGFEQKIEVHHKEGVCNWDAIIDVIREQLLCDPTKLQALCPECHDNL